MPELKRHIFLILLLAAAWGSAAQNPLPSANNPLKYKGSTLFAYEAGEGQVFWTDGIVHPEGLITVVGTVLSKGVHYLALARFLPDGSPDCSFQQEGISELSIPVDWEYLIRMERLPDGKFLVLFNPAQEINALFMARFFEDGYPDTGFGDGGVLRVPIDKPTHFMDMLVQADGGIIVAGFEENTQTGAHTCRVMRILPSGRIDEAFTPQPPPPTPHSFHLITLAEQADGKIMLAAYINGQLGVARLLPDGKKDPTFGDGKCIFYPIPGFRPYDIQALPDASWLVLGGGHQGPHGWPIAVKGLPDGRLDAGFGTEGVYAATGEKKIAAAGWIQPDGRWTITGMSECSDQTSEFFVARFLEDGRPDPTFGQEGYVAPLFHTSGYQGSGMWLKPLQEGKVLAGGTVNFKGALACLDSLGRPANSFGKDGTVLSVWGGNNPLNVECSKVLAGAGGSMIAVGTLSKPFNAELLAIRVESNGTLDTQFHQKGFATINLPGPITGIDALVQPDGKLVLGGRMRHTRTEVYDLDYAACRLNPDGSLDTTFAGEGYITLDRGRYDLLGNIALQSDGRILLAGDSENPETNERELTVFRLLPSGLPDRQFGTNGIVTIAHTPGGAFASLLVQEDGKILLLDAHSSNTFDLLRLYPDGRIDRAFGIDGLYEGAFPEKNQPLQSLLAAMDSGNRILIAGQFPGKTYLSRLEKYGEIDETFGNGGLALHHLPPTISQLGLLPDNQILLAGSGSNAHNGNYYFFAARFLPNGSPAPGFGENGLVITELPAFSYLSSLLLMDDGTIILGGKGFSDESDPHSDMVLIRYLPTLDAGHICPKHQFPYLDIYPYPLENEIFELSYNLPERSEVRITLHTPDGEELACLLQLCRLAGDHRDLLQLPFGLPSGRYLLKVCTEEVEASVQFFYHSAGKTEAN